MEYRSGRGTGITLNQKYSWCQQPNGKYTIFNVPIFSTYEKTGDKIDEKITIKDLEKIIENFKIERDKGYYPPIFINHQSKGSENADKVGFANALHLEDGVILADFTEFNQCIKEEIEKINFPSRSVEFDPENKIITGVALLKSRRPFFKFPLLSLTEAPVELGGIKTQYQEQNIKIFKESKRMGFFSVKPEESQEKQSQEKPKLEKKEEPKLEKEEMEETPQEEVQEGTKLDQILSAIMQVLAKLVPSEEQLPAEKPELIALGGSNFEDKSMKLKDIQKIIQLENSKLRKEFQEERKKFETQISELSQMKATSIWEDRLRGMCEVTGEDFESNQKFFASFESDKDRQKFLDYMEVQSQTYPESSATRFAASVGNAPDSEEFKKYEANSPRVKSVLKKAQKDYKLTAGQRNESKGKAFLKRFPSEEYFLDYVAKYEEKEAGFYQNEFFKS